MARAGSLRDELVKLVSDLTARLEQVSVEFTAMTDPDKAVIEIEKVELKAAEDLAVERSAWFAAREGQRSAVEARVAADSERDEARSAADEFEAEVSAANAVHDEDLLVLAAVQTELAAAVAKGEALAADLTTVTADRDVEATRAADLARELIEVREQAADLQTSLTRTEEKLGQTQERFAEAKDRADRAETARTEADQVRHDADTRTAVAEAAVVGLKRDVDGLKQERIELTEKLEAAIGRASANETRAAGLTERVAELQRETGAKVSGPRPGPGSSRS